MNHHTKDTNTDWARLFLILAVGLTAAFQVGKAPPVVLPLREDLGMSLYTAGWVISSINIMGFCISLVVGSIADWLGSRRVIFAGLIIIAAGSLLGSAAPTSSWLIATRFFEGLGFILVVVSAPGLIVKVINPDDRRVAFGIWGGYMPIGIAVMIMLAPFLVSIMGWRGVWQVNSALLLGLAVIFLVFTRTIPNTSNSASFSLIKILTKIRETVGSGGPLILALGFTAYAFQFLAVMGFLPTVLVEREGLAPKPASMLTALVVLMNAPGNLLGGWLLKRRLPRWRLMAGTSVVMGICGGLLFAPALPLWSRYLFFLTFSFVGGIIPAACLEGAVARAPSRDHVATSNGLVVMGSNTGLLSGPPIIAFAVEYFGGWNGATIVLLIGAALSLLFALVLRYEEKIKGIH